MKPETAVLILEGIGVTTAIATALIAAIPMLKAWAAHKASKRVEEVVSTLEVVLNLLIIACDIGHRVLPRMVIGPLPGQKPISRSLPPRAGDTLPGPPVVVLKPGASLDVADTLSIRNVGDGDLYTTKPDKDLK